MRQSLSLPPQVHTGEYERGRASRRLPRAPQALGVRRLLVGVFETGWLPGNCKPYRTLPQVMTVFGPTYLYRRQTSPHELITYRR